MPRESNNEIDRLMGVRLRAARMHSGMTQQHLAASVGLSYQQIQKYEVGANSISPRYLVQFADILDRPLVYFFEDSPVDSISKGQNRPSPASRVDIEIVQLLAQLDPITKAACRDLLKAVVERTSGKEIQRVA